MALDRNTGEVISVRRRHDSFDAGLICLLILISKNETHML